MGYFESLQNIIAISANMRKIKTKIFTEKEKTGESDGESKKVRRGTECKFYCWKNDNNGVNSLFFNIQETRNINH